MKKLHWVTVLFCLAASAFGQSNKTKASAHPEGVIVSIDGQELVIDLGSSQGLPEHARVQIYRRLDVIHPVTKQAIIDRFPIGSIELDEVGQKLSICRDWKELLRAPKPGDFVVFTPLLETVATPITEPIKVEPTKPPTSVPVLPPKDPAKEAAEIAFAASMGKSLPDRIQIWEEYLKAYPQSEFKDTIGKELSWLRERLSEQRKASEPKPVVTVQSPTKKEKEILRATVSVPNVVEVGLPLAVSVWVEKPQLAQAVRLLIRRIGDPSYQTISLQRDSDAYWRTTLPQTWVEPGKLQYFVEVARADSELESIIGTAATPAEVKVIDPPEDILDEKNRSTSSTTIESVNFKSGPIADQFFRLTSDYRYQVNAGPLSAFRLGVGIFKGTGGTFEEFQQGERRARSINFGYAEIELGLYQYVGVAGRLIVGSQSIDEQEQEPLQNFLGFRTELRIGEEEATRLLLGTSVNQDIGNETWIKLAFNVKDKIPMSGGVVLTNLPVGAERGVSLEYSTGLQITPWCKAMAIVGLNARTITHFGFTAGSNLVFNW